MKRLYVAAVWLIAQVHWVITLIKCVLVAGVLFIAAYLGWADPVTDSFGSFLMFLQKGVFMLSLTGGVLIFLLYSVAAAVAVVIFPTRQQGSSGRSGGEDSCGGK